MKKILIVVLVLMLSFTVSGCMEDNVNPVQKAYEAAINIEFEDLDEDGRGGYTYNGIKVLDDEIDSSYEFSSTLNQGAIYRSVAKQLEGFYLLGQESYGNWGKEMVPVIFGFEKPDSYSEMAEYAGEACEIIATKNSIGQVLYEFENLSVCEGEFDYKKGAFEFTISDLAVAAKELGVSEEMLGYIIAWLDEFGAKTVFSENSCTSSLTYNGGSVITEKDFLVYIDYKDEIDVMEIIEDQPPGNLQYYATDVTNEIIKEDEDEFDGFTTYRGVQFMHSPDAVRLSYGYKELKTLDKKSDDIYLAFKNYNKEHFGIIDSCSTYLAYDYEDSAQIIFYFNENSEMVLVIYINTIVA